MEKNTRVSIIIPAYNASKYIKEAIDSALNQTYKNIEIIVVNDGSTDKTDKIVKSYGNKIKYFEKENGGVSSALNLGISKMTGEYFSWLSHDDRYYPNKIETQINYLNKIDLNKKVILYSDYDLMNNKSKIYDKCIKNHNELIEKPEYGLLRGAINGITLLIPKEAFINIGLFDEKLKCVQDYALWEKMQEKYKFIHQPEILATTRIHDKQQGNINPLMITEGDAFWTNLIKHTPISIMEKLEGTEFNFYIEMFRFLETTPYKGTLNFINEKTNLIKEFSQEKINTILVSVIIPFFNRVDKTILAIKSVLTQTHKNIEIILVNDGSTENVNPILELIKNNKNKVEMISLSINQGASNARNIGIKNANGQYIAFLDSDDLYLKDKIKIQLQEMYLKGYLFSHTSYIRKGLNNEKIINSGKLKGLVIPSIIFSCEIATPTIMINSKLFRRNKYNYDINIKIGEDVCFYLNILKKIKVLGIDNALTIVNVNEETSAYNYNKQKQGILNIIKFIINDKDLLKYENEFAKLLKIYINLTEEKIHQNKQLNQFKILRYIKNKINLFQKLKWLYKNDRNQFKILIIYKLKKYPTILKFLKK